jgi:hypothetical protein
MGNTKIIATMFASHGASRKHRWAALGDWANWSDGCYLGAISENSGESCGRTEPDVHLIKQVEQVTKSALEGPTWRFARIPSMGVTDAVAILVFLIWQLRRWLLFDCKNSQERPRATYLRRGSPAMLPVLTGGGSTNRATWAAEPLLCHIGETDIKERARGKPRCIFTRASAY